MRFIFDKCHDELRSNKAIMDKMIYTAGDRINLMSQDLREMASDYDVMYKKFTSKLVVGPDRTVYNGDAMGDWYEGPHGNKVQGLMALREFSRMVISGMTKAIKEDSKK